MDYDFGDILDARNTPIGHFIAVVGETTSGENEEVMYYVITSRVYAVFSSILLYFNDCLTRKDKSFLQHFSKEKGKARIAPHGLLREAIFLDSSANYKGCLETESMVTINKDPEHIDKSVLETLRKDKKAIFKTKLAKLDALHLIQTILLSSNVSPEDRSKISDNFDKIKKSLK